LGVEDVGLLGIRAKRSARKRISGVEGPMGLQ